MARGAWAGVALTVGAALAASAAPARPAEPPRPPAATAAVLPPGVTTGTLPGGGTYLIKPMGGTSAAVALWFRAPVAGFGTDAAPGVGRLAAATVSASKPITGTALAQAVERLGGRLGVAAYPGSIAVTALVPADRVPATVRAMSAVYFTPVLDEDGLRVARRDLAEESLLHRFDDTSAVDDALVETMFRSGPTRYATYPSAATLATPLAALRTYAERAFRPANATLVVVGPVARDVVGSAVPGREGAAPGTEPPVPAVRAADATPAPLPSSPSRKHVVGLGWVGPPIASEADATALDFLADSLFRDESGSVPRATAGLGSAVEGKFVTYYDPGVFLVTIAGGDVARARDAVERAVRGAARPADAASFARAKSAFVYHILADTSGPAEAADTLGWYSVEGAPLYAPARGTDGAYFRSIAALTPASVAAVAKRYLDAPPVVIDATAPPSPAASSSPRPSAT